MLKIQSVSVNFGPFHFKQSLAIFPFKRNKKNNQQTEATDGEKSCSGVDKVLAACSEVKRRFATEM